jgi:hypothetical protein
MSIVERTIGSKNVHRGLVALAVTLCRCDRRKKKGMSFCSTCYHRLPLEIKRNLYQKAGHGYEEAYDTAIKHLEGEKADA